MKFRILSRGLSLGLFFCLANLGRAENNFLDLSSKISINLHKALALKKEKRNSEAASVVADTYFDLFEGQGMENAVGALSPNLKSDLEAQFNQIRSEAMSGTDSTHFESLVENLSGQLQGTAFRLQDQQGPWQVFLTAFMILLREGFEAILIVGAIATFLIKTGHQKLMRLVASAVQSALAASILTAIAFGALIKVTAAQQELIEGLTMLLACAVLFTVGHWLVARSESQHWTHFIKENIAGSLSSGSKKALWFTCFLAVYREGAETVLFYQALWSNASRQGLSILSGFAFAAFALFAMYQAFKKGILRIPMKPFFMTTSFLLYFLAFVFAGQAVIELQAGGYILVHELKGWPTIQFLGIYPNLQSVLLQGLFVLSLVGSFVWLFVKKRFLNKSALGALS